MICCYPEQNLISNSNISVKETDEYLKISYNSNYLIGKFMYYMYIDNNIAFSFDFFELAAFAKSKNIILLPNQNIIPFFIEKGYAPMDYTIISGIKKVPNLCTFIFNKLTKTISYSLNIQKSKQQDEVEIVKNTIFRSFDPLKKNVILFSGGLDSTLLAYLAKDKLPREKINLVTGVYRGIDFEPNSIDEKYSALIAEKLDLNFSTVDLDLDSVSNNDIENIIFLQPNTAHFSLLFSAINEYYKNDDVNFISGQQADSILNFGSTASVKFKKGRIQGIGELVRRLIYLSNNKYLTSLFHFFNKDLEINKGYPQLSLFCGLKKLPYKIDKEKYYNLSSIYHDFLERIEEKEKIINSNHLFYVFYYLSGSDASGIINIFSYNEHNPLPFNDTGLISYFSSKKYTLKDKVIPKKVIVDILKDDKELWKLLSEKPNVPNISYEVIFNKLSDNLNIREEFYNLSHQFGLNLDFSFNSFHLLKCIERIDEN